MSSNPGPFTRVSSHPRRGVPVHCLKRLPHHTRHENKREITKIEGHHTTTHTIMIVQYTTKPKVGNHSINYPELSTFFNSKFPVEWSFCRTTRFTDRGQSHEFPLAFSLSLPSPSGPGKTLQVDIRKTTIFRTLQ